MPRSRKTSEQVQFEKKQKLRIKKNKQLNKFLEMEAQLGSDNEENDDMIKAINRDDEEEDEDGQDEDLDGFVVHEADEEEIGDAD